MNKATVKLLALLEERGVTPKMIPFELDAIAWQGDICKWVAVYDEDEEAFAVAVYENYLSAEQAIAATLGEQIVRCRDCRHMHTVRHWLGMDVDECWLHADRESGALGKERTEPDGFCSWGERKEVAR